MNKYYWSTKTTIKQSQLKIHLFPNPAKENICLVGSSGYCTMQCFDQQGRLMISKSVTNFEKIPVDDLAPGLYIVKVTSAEGSDESKFLKQ